MAVSQVSPMRYEARTTVRIACRRSTMIRETIGTCVERFATREEREARVRELQAPIVFKMTGAGEITVPRVHGLARLTENGPGGEVVYLVTYSRSRRV